MDKIKAWVAGGVAVVTTLLSGVAASLTNDGVVDTSEWLTVAIATVGAFGAVFAGTYAAPANQPKPE